MAVRNLATPIIAISYTVVIFLRTKDLNLRFIPLGPSLTADVVLVGVVEEHF